MKILITGSSGHLGEALARTLIKRKLNYVGVDILPSDFTTHPGSITDRNFIKECLKEIDVVLHTATLHKPHIATHSYQDFVDTNITGTLNLLEESIATRVKAFIFTSTTSAFGDALTPPADYPATWITEEVKPIPKNIYGATKVAAEDFCQLFYRNFKLPCVILRTSRFFPEEDDQKAVREEFDNLNLKINELLYRRADIEDIVNAHFLAIEKAPKIGFDRFIISATTPFDEQHLAELNTNAPAVVERLYPEYKEIFARRKWKMIPKIDRVYVNQKARKALGWNPKYTFKYALDCLKNNVEPGSELARLVGSKGYHSQKFKDGFYPVK